MKDSTLVIGPVVAACRSLLASRAMPAPLLPYAQFDDFLSKEQLHRLIQCTLRSEKELKPATIKSADESVVNADWRIGLTLRNFGPTEDELRDKLRGFLPTISAALGATFAVPPVLELELAAHGDGAFYRPHIDISIGDVRKDREGEDDRLLSAVLYFHAEPKSFSGGELRLFHLGVQPGDEMQEGTFVDLQPRQNSLVVFHSWVTHEVRRVSCPSRKFRDYRFAVNCWFCRKHD